MLGLGLEFIVVVGVELAVALEAIGHLHRAPARAGLVALEHVNQHVRRLGARQATRVIARVGGTSLVEQQIADDGVRPVCGPADDHLAPVGLFQ